MALALATARLVCFAGALAAIVLGAAGLLNRKSWRGSQHRGAVIASALFAGFCLGGAGETVGGPIEPLWWAASGVWFVLAFVAYRFWPSSRE